MSDAITPVERFDAIATKSLVASTLSDGHVPVEAADSYRDAASAVREILEASASLEGKLRDIAAQHASGFLTKQARDAYTREAIEAGQALHDDAKRRIDRGVEAAEQLILTSALPKIASDSREALARDELNVALGDATGPGAASRLLQLATTGSPEVQAVLNTPYARTALVARQVPNVDRLLRDIKVTVAHSGSTPESVKASEALEKLSNLPNAQVAASRAFHFASGKS